MAWVVVVVVLGSLSEQRIEQEGRLLVHAFPLEQTKGIMNDDGVVLHLLN